MKPRPIPLKDLTTCPPAQTGPNSSTLFQPFDRERCGSPSSNTAQLRPTLRRPLPPPSHRLLWRSHTPGQGEGPSQRTKPKRPSKPAGESSQPRPLPAPAAPPALHHLSDARRGAALIASPAFRSPGLPLAIGASFEVRACGSSFEPLRPGTYPWSYSSIRARRRTPPCSSLPILHRAAL